MADGSQPPAGTSGGGHWLEATPPNFRANVTGQIMRRLAELFRRQPWEQLHKFAVILESAELKESSSREDYFNRISRKMIEVQQRLQQVGQATSDLQQQAQTVHQMPPANAVQGNPSVPGRPPQLQNMHIKVKEEEEEEQPSVLGPMAPAVQLQPRQATVVTQIQTQCPARQLQLTTPVAKIAEQLQGQHGFPPNDQQNHRHLLRRNSSGICMQQPQSQPQLMRMDHREQRHQMQGTQQADVAMMQVGHPGGQNKNQQSEGPQTSAMFGSAGEVDWRDDIFQKISSLKNAHFLELTELDRTVLLPRITNEQLESLSKEKAARYKFKEKLRYWLSFLQLQKSNIPENMKEQFDKYEDYLRRFVHSYRESKARSAEKKAGRQSQNCGAAPSTCGTDSQQGQHEQQPAEGICQPTQIITATPPPALQQNHGDHLVGQAQDDVVRGAAQAPSAINPTAGDTAPFTGGTCSREMQQEPQLTQNVPAGTPPAQQQNHGAHSVGQAADDEARGGAEAPVAMETLIKRGIHAARSLSPAPRLSLADDMGVNLKRAFRHTTSWSTMDGICVSFESSGGSSYKIRKTHNSAVLAEIRAAYGMLVDTVISIIGDRGKDGSTVIEFRYNAVSLAPDLRSSINAPEISTKLLVPADYPRSSPALLDGGGARKGIPGAVDMAFRCALHELPEARSIEEMARAWDSCVRRAVVEFAQQHGGGTFSSRYSRWESCISA